MYEQGFLRQPFTIKNDGKFVVGIFVNIDPEIDLKFFVEIKL